MIAFVNIFKIQLLLILISNEKKLDSFLHLHFDYYEYSNLKREKNMISDKWDKFDINLNLLTSLKDDRKNYGAHGAKRGKKDQNLKRQHTVVEM